MPRATELIVIGCAAMALGALLIFLLVRRSSHGRRAEKREHLLNAAAAALDSASTTDEVYLVGVHAAVEILGHANAAVELQVDGSTVAGADLGTAASRVRAEVPVAASGEDVVLVVRTDDRPSRQARHGLRKLAAQLALALERTTPAVEIRERRTA